MMQSFATASTTSLSSNRVRIGKSASYDRMGGNDEEKKGYNGVVSNTYSTGTITSTQIEEYDERFLQVFTIDDDDDDDQNEKEEENRAPVPVDTFDLEHGDYEDNFLNIKQQVCSPLSLESTTGSDRPPPAYRCPLTLQLMDDPVNDGCGHCFERRAIQDWLEYSDVCPISRKPMSYNDLFGNGHLKARIQQWKEDHPLYQHVDKHYADRQVEDMLSVTSQNSHSQFELMLLPQERQVLNIVKVRAHRRRKREDFSKCMWSIGITVTLFIVGATVLALVFLDMELRGPI